MNEESAGQAETSPQKLTRDTFPETLQETEENKDYLENQKEEELRRTLYQRIQNATQYKRARTLPSTKSIARAQKLINRLKRFNDPEKNGIIKEIRELDLSMYLGEIAAALCDVSVFKQKDVLALVEICVELQLTYPTQFAQEFLSGLKKAHETTPPVPRQRVLIRLIIECRLSGLLAGHDSFLCSVLNDCFESVPTVTKYVGNCRANSIISGITPAWREQFPAQCLNWVEFFHLSTIEGIARNYAIQLFGIKPSTSNGLVSHEKDLAGNETSGEKTTDSIDLLDVEGGERGKDGSTVVIPSQATQALPDSIRKQLRAALEKYVRQKSVVLFLVVHEALLEQELLNQQQRLQRVTVDAENENRLTQLQLMYERVTHQLESLLQQVESPRKLRLASVLYSLSNLLNDRKPEAVESRLCIHVPEAEELPQDFFLKFLVEGLSTIFPRLYMDFVAPNSKENASHTRLKPADKKTPKPDVVDSSGSIEQEVQWTDHVERSFYEDLCDLKEFIPAPLLGIRTIPKKSAETSVTGSKDSSGAVDDNEVPQATGGTADDETHKIVDEMCDKDDRSQLDPEKTSPAAGGALGVSSIENYITEVLHFAETCGIVDSTAAAAIDSFARAFFLRQLNIKQNRRRLAKALLNTPKNDLHMLPGIARLTAVLGPCCPDVAHLVITGARKEFLDSHTENSPYKLEYRIKCVRFLGELCKFKLVAINEILDIITLFADDLNATSVEILCHLLECCGRFIAGTRGADQRFQNILQRVTRIKTNKSVPTRVEVYFEEQIVLLEAAFQRMRGNFPPVWQRIVRGGMAEKDPPMKLFIEHLVWEAVVMNWEGDGEIPTALVKKFRRLHWNDPLTLKWLRDSFLDFHYRIHVKGVSKCSQLLASITRCQPQFVVSCVDELLERMLIAAEDDFPSQRQRRIMEAKLLSEFSADKIVDTSLIMDIIYNLIGFTTSPSAFGASHFRVPFDLLKKACLKNDQLLDDPADKSLLPVDLCLKLGELPPKTAEASFRICEHSFLDEKNMIERKGMLPNRLAEILFRVNVTENSGRRTDDFFKIKLACVILKGCWSSIIKRSWPLRVESFIICLIYAVAWKTQFADGRLPLDIVFDVRETLNEISSCHSKRDYGNLLEISILLADEMVQNSKIITKYFSNITNEADPLVPHSLMNNLTSVQWTTATSSTSVNPATSGVGESTLNPFNLYAEEESDDVVSHGGDRTESEVIVDSDDSTSDHQQQKPHTLFDKELESLITESVDMIKTSSSYTGFNNRSGAEIRLPHHILKNRNVNRAADTTNDEASDLVHFTLVTKKAAGGKYMMKNLNATVGSKLASALSKPVSDQMEDTVDRQIIKQFVMDHLDRMGAEEQQDTDHGYGRHQPYDARQPICQSSPTTQTMLGLSHSGSRQGGPNTRQTTRKTGKLKDKPIREARRKLALDKDSDDI